MHQDPDPQGGERRHEEDGEPDRLADPERHAEPDHARPAEFPEPGAPDERPGGTPRLRRRAPVALDHDRPGPEHGSEEEGDRARGRGKTEGCPEPRRQRRDGDRAPRPAGRGAEPGEGLRPASRAERGIRGRGERVRCPPAAEGEEHEHSHRSRREEPRRGRRQRSERETDDRIEGEAGRLALSSRPRSHAPEHGQAADGGAELLHERHFGRA